MSLPLKVYAQDEAQRRRFLKAAASWALEKEHNAVSLSAWIIEAAEEKAQRQEKKGKR